MTKIQHSGTLDLHPVAVLSPEQRRREIELLLAKRAAATGSVVTAAASELEQPEAAEELEAEPVIRAPSKRRSAKRSRVH